ncbi:hypothetical protein MPTK1_8g17220 [Marchantia polymorpha subsp. ruderalis]|uniref:Uncharacterized protein n=1 Tax=Marchantia polymorpha TaxID=3197 RepID=A0A2R6X886_MARPO|nr:hypothetical protein MARPO_0030s0055 [Marchantia polymorpha]BBN20193.1 hypothetical protein Mp_8g17220 [Marchantia polymorpha subsp. ruderalis]|eukprot:PTQ42310.1 hypothetical protein MARPO_0030s0055 [Marchantia polymorpha]
MLSKRGFCESNGEAWHGAFEEGEKRERFFRTLEGPNQMRHTWPDVRMMEIGSNLTVVPRLALFYLHNRRPTLGNSWNGQEERERESHIENWVDDSH